MVVTDAHTPSDVPPPPKRTKGNDMLSGISRQIAVRFRSRRGKGENRVFTKFVLHKENTVSGMTATFSYNGGNA